MLIESFFVKKITTGGLVLNNNNKVLLIQKKKLWDLQRVSSIDLKVLKGSCPWGGRKSGIDQSYLKLVRPLIIKNYYSKKRKKIPKKANWFLMLWWCGYPHSRPNESIDDANGVIWRVTSLLSNSRAYVRAVISAIHLINAKFDHEHQYYSAFQNITDAQYQEKFVFK